LIDLVCTLTRGYLLQAVFKNLGDVTDEYLKNIQVMRSSAKRFNSAIFNFCEKDWVGV